MMISSQFLQTTEEDIPDNKPGQTWHFSTRTETMSYPESTYIKTDSGPQLKKAKTEPDSTPLPHYNTATESIDNSSQNTFTNEEHGNNGPYVTSNDNGPLTKRNEVLSNDTLPQIEVGDLAESDIILMKKIIKTQLTGKLVPYLHQSALKSTYDELYTILEHTIKDGEGHSTLLMGPRGSGKSLIIKKAMENLRQSCLKQFIYIKLNALLHTDDKLALREIARQLDANFAPSSSAESGGTFEQRAISDTFTNIMLALDSNASERSDESFENTTRIVFVIDEIDKFTGSNKQTLLYNLFDLTQSSKIPICVIGVSTKTTSRELFEKRVKSRFSQRIITTKSPPSLKSFTHDASLALKIHESDTSRFTNKKYPQAWNTRIDQLFELSPIFKRPLFLLYHTTKSFQDFYTSCMIPVSSLSTLSPFPKESMFEKYINMQSKNYVQSVVAALSKTETLLMISAARWLAKSDTPNVNFNLAYKEYADLMKLLNIEATALSSSSSYIDSAVLAGIKVSQKLWSQKIMRDSWANLYKYGLLFDAITSNNEVNANNNHNMYKLVVLEDSKSLQLDITLEEIGALVEENLKKLCKL